MRFDTVYELILPAPNQWTTAMAFGITGPFLTLISRCMYDFGSTLFAQDFHFAHSKKFNGIFDFTVV